MDEIQKSLDEFVDHIKKHAQQLSMDVEITDVLYTEKDYPSLKALLVDTANKMERNISKVHMLYGGMTVDSLISLLKDTETNYVDLIQSAHLFMSCGLSNAAKREIINAVSSLTESLENLMEHVGKSHQQKQKALKPAMTGAVWDACKSFSKLSDSNKKACMKETLNFVRIIRDMGKELEEDDDDFDDLLDDLDMDDEDFEGEDGMEESDEESNKFVKSEVSTIVSEMQHIFESLFKIMNTTLPEAIPFTTIPTLNTLSAISYLKEKEICDSLNDFCTVVYGVDDHNKKDMEKLVATMKQLEGVVSDLFKESKDLVEKIKEIAQKVNTLKQKLHLLVSSTKPYDH